MEDKDLEKFVDIIYPNKSSLDEVSASGDTFIEDLSDLGINYKTSFSKTNFHIDEEKSILDALYSPSKAGLLDTLLSTPIGEINGQKKKIYKIFIDLYTSVGIWNPKTNKFFPDEQLDPNDLKIKNKIGKSTLLQSIIYLAEIGEVDERFKGWWRKFLNKYAAKLDVVKEFSIKDSDLSQKGLYLWVFGNEIEYVGIASNSYTNTFNHEYASVEKYKCTLNGQVTRCKLNFNVQLALNQGKTVDYYICPISPTELKQIYNKNKSVLNNYLPENGKNSSDQQVLEIIESCLMYKLNTITNGINGKYSNAKLGKDLKNNGKLNK